MGRTVDRGVLVGIVLLLAVLLVNAGLAYRNTRQLDEDAVWVAHTHEVRDLTGEVMLALVDAETGERGFLITGKEEFLQPYDAALARLADRVARLKEKTADNESQQERIKRLEAKIGPRLVLLKQGIDLRRKNAEEAWALTASGEGKEQMDAIRALIAEMKQEETVLLQDREAQSKHSYQVAVATGLIAALAGLASVVLIFRDVSQRKQAMKALRQSEERFARFMQHLPGLAWIKDVQGRYVYANDAAMRVFRRPRDDLYGKRDDEIFPPETAEQFKANDRNALANPAGIQVIETLKHEDGAIHYSIVSKFPIPGADGATVLVGGMAIDITERRQAEQTLRESEERLRLALEAGRRAEQDARFLADASAALAGLVDYGSTLQKVARLAVPTFADWCTVDMLDESGALKRLAVAHVDPSKVELAHELQRRFPPEPDSPRGAWNILRTGQSEIIAEITDDFLQANVRDADRLRIVRELGLKSYMAVPLAVRDKVLGVVTFIAAESGRRYDAADLALAEDLAHRAAVAVENARLYQAVREADRRKDEFLALLGHELRNPLAPIWNALHVLKLSGADAGIGQKAREMIERQVEHLIRLVDDLLDVSRIMRGKVELRRQPVDLATVITRAVETSQSVIDSEGHELTIALPPEPLSVNGDLVRLAQVVNNLLNNAAKYTDRGGKIGIAASQENGEAVLRVRDTGIGIAAEQLPKLFDMFYQGERRIKDSQGGLGIGLSLVRGLVELHDGSVEAHSAGPDQGSEFIVRLPLVVKNEDKTDQPRQTDAKLEGRATARRVLVVDDNVDAADSLAMLLRLQGHEVVIAYDGPSALASAQLDPPALAFLDLGMPKMNGFELAEAFRTHPALKSVLLVAVTGWGQPEDRQRTKDAGFDHHLVKPVEPEALHRVLVYEC